MRESIYKKALFMLRGTGIGKYKIVNKLNRFMVSKLPKIIEIDGIKFQSLEYDYDHNNVFLFQIGNQFGLDYCEKHIKEGYNVVDIGANIGYYSLNLSRMVGDSGKVYSFEPNLENYNGLLVNIELNKIKNIIAVQKGVSDESAKTILYKHPDNTQGCSIIKSEDVKGFLSYVDTISLDEYFKDHKQIDFMKIDVEGAEMHVIKGGMKLFGRCKNMKLITEFSDVHTKPTYFYPKLLEELGFNLIGMIKDGMHLTPITISNLESFNGVVDLVWEKP